MNHSVHVVNDPRQRFSRATNDNNLDTMFTPNINAEVTC